MTRRPRVALAVVVVLAVVLGLLVLVFATSEPSSDRRVSSPLVGEVAPLVQGRTLDGDEYDLDRHRGRWVVVNFFARWCIPCRREHPELVEFGERHERGGDATLVSVIYDDDPDNVTKFFDEAGGDWPVVIDPEGRVSLEYGVTGVPESFLVAPDGNVVAKLVGGVTADGLDRVIADIVAGSR
jgi:cytochrome c biogenesis protein CcmG/thiol:disulfide interchange protein DsbE